MESNILTFDIGTQSTRAAIVAMDGTILGIHQIAHGLENPHPGWAQQNPEDWWQEACTAAAKVLDKTGVAQKSIVAVCTCGQMHGPVGVDARGAVTTPRVQLWCDKRCEEQCARIRAEYDERELMQLSGNPLVPAWPGLKVRWHKDHEQQAYLRTRWYLVPKDFINYRLTGVAAADPSEMSCSFLWDFERDGYSRDLAEIVGVDLDKFAPVHPSHAVIGAVTEEASRMTGICAGTPVVAGGGDFPVSMLGFGIVGDGITADVTGTSTLLATHSRRPLLHPSIQNLRHVVDGWIPFTILDCGGMSMTWCRDLVGSMRGAEVSYEELIAIASKAAPGSDGLMFYPYMLGERRHENTRSRGAYFGITLNHAAPHFVRSVMEGVALSMGKDIADFERQGHLVQRLLSVGGGTRNELWNQIKANVTARAIELSDEPEAGIRGAALLAAAGVGLIDDLAAVAVARRTSSRVVRPDSSAVDQYRAVQREYVRVYEHMLGFWSSGESN